MKTTLEKLKEKLLKNNGYRREINKQDLSFEIAESIIDARIRKGITQKELAKKLKTKQSGIARLESGRNYPSFKTLEKIARILGIKINNPLGMEADNTTNCYFRLPVELLHNSAVVEQKSSMVNSILYNL
ncbi:MAG: helix-turn-helix transcriptional regulator [Patescibacteria group bacterium]